jgi:glycosyltransferase involved in cell wall biosynthesis
MSPLVTCLCVTRDRPEWLRHAVQYFLNQDFSSAELLILTDADCPIERHDDIPRIRVINYLERPASLGTKRNIGCGLALGKYIAIWDDDDYHGPHRIKSQLNLLTRSQVAVTAYRTMLFTDMYKWWMYDGVIPMVGIGGSLLFEKAWWQRSPFEEVNIAEDNRFIRSAWMNRQLVTEPADDNMVATIHSRNTSVREVKPGGNYAEIAVSSVPCGLIDAFLAVEQANRAFNQAESL